MTTVTLPALEGAIPGTREAAGHVRTLQDPRHYTPREKPFNSRIAFAAAHVVANPDADHSDAGKPVGVDWEATLSYRHHLWSHGFAVAEAMDTSQRGMGLDWAAAQTLIALSVKEARSVGARVFCGTGTDHLVPGPEVTLAQVTDAYLHQIATVQKLGGRIILMASRALAVCARGADDYAQVYARVLAEADQPVVIHWLGDMFDPKLSGYWGSQDLTTAMHNCLAVLGANAAKIDGIKISLLDAKREIDMRRKLPAGMRMYTGDDFNYPELIRGDGVIGRNGYAYSDALLGIFDAIAPVAAAAFHALDAGDVASYEAILAPTVPLSRHIFKTPTYFYKTGITFLAWLNGFQDHFVMVGNQHTARSKAHLAQLLALADDAGLLRDPDLAAHRWGQYASK